MIEFGFVKSNENLTVRREEPLICFEINPELRQNQIGCNTINKLNYGILLIETYDELGDDLSKFVIAFNLGEK